MTAPVLPSLAVVLLARLVGSFLLYDAVVWIVWLLLTRGQSDPSVNGNLLSLGLIPLWAFFFWGIGRMRGYQEWAMRSRARRMEAYDVNLPPEGLTAAALVAAIVASAAALPLFFRSFSYSGLPGELYVGPSGWPSTLSIAAFIIGVPSMVLALVARHRERRRRSDAGRKLAKYAVRVAIAGAFIWGWPFVVAASSGL